MTDTNDSSKASLLLPDPSSTADASTGDQTVPASSNSRGGQNSRGRYHNSRGRGNSNSGSKRKKQDQSRTAYKRNRDSKWEPRNAEGASVREEREGDEGAEKEERRPKKKVAVLIGYCGTGYRGMQLNPPHKSIEGDLFEAFVQAGAISKANSDDPKKSSLVRCARTDKGVHAVGNVISLKLIIEDPDIIEKINYHLPEQIRVWGIVRTVGSFSSYQQCDSRRYEYLVPSHCFLPPHPKSYLAKICYEVAEKEGDLEGFLERNKECDGWWEEVNKKIYEQLDDVDKEVLDKALEYEVKSGAATERRERMGSQEIAADSRNMDVDPDAPPGEDTANGDINVGAGLWKKIGAIYRAEKKTYRISPERLQKAREGFKSYEGTHNFHNYTIQKTFKDPSSKRFIKSFEVLDPIIINNTEWLSLRIHGQSFMMHQIRKMVGMLMMVVRTGCPLERIREACGPRVVSIPKAPSLGLLLESPVFDAYNRKAERDFQKEPIDFSKYAKEMDAFRDEMIYTKLFEEEEKAHVYTQFVHFIDSFRSPLFHYLTSAGLKALDEAEKEQGAKTVGLQSLPDNESEDEGAAKSAEAG
ncbi:pseudouridine synthase [Choiromyces venosus 120613-1]|uniref:tRNA pseudouridine synthase 1 n=1 Tax=Choiromyces venosus 120613-1 TaxID=1336337 RepID=A0A3N4JYB1_9PEZI|nr:pseudouridine synthase [Choiromyces venosus 120613-1]